MEKEEFNIWIDDYSNRFPGVSRSLAESALLVNDWWHVLWGFELSEVQEATRYVTTLDPQPFPSEHLPKLLSFLKSRRFKPAAKSVELPSAARSFRCQDCRDGGTIYVYHPMAYGPIRAGNFSISKQLREIVVGCNCDAGKAVTCPRDNPRQPDPLKSFCRQTMCQVTELTIDEQVLELTEFVNEHYRPRNFNTEFAEFA